MLTLQLIRHAKTNPDSETGRDFDRALLEKGIAQANMLGEYLHAGNILPGKILCSTAKRTRQTEAIICQQMTSYTGEFRDALYHATAENLLLELADETEPLITLIGHNEGISDLASYCTGDFIPMHTCEFIAITFPFDHWDMLSRNTGSIALRYRPEAFLP